MARSLAQAYDDLERRIDELAAQEELDAMRPELDGEQIMEVLGIDPGPLVGQAYKFLLNLRLDEGELGEEEATHRLLGVVAGARRVLNRHNTAEYCGKEYDGDYGE